MADRGNEQNAYKKSAYTAEGEKNLCTAKGTAVHRSGTLLEPTVRKRGIKRHCLSYIFLADSAWLPFAVKILLEKTVSPPKALLSQLVLKIYHHGIL